MLAAIASTYNSELATYDTGEIGAEFLITDSNSKVYFEQLLADREQIEAELGYELIWHSPETTKSSKIHVRRTADIQDRSDWPAQFAWLLSKLEDLHRVFGGRIRAL